MSGVVLQQNHIVKMHASEDLDSSNEDIFLELSHAWGYVRKWYNSKSRQNTGSSRATFKKGGKSHGPNPSNTSFQDLPVNIQMKIFSFLDVYSLSKAAMVCCQWYSIANDEVLWESKLKSEIQKWQVIDHLSHPELYRETMADIHPKEIYLNCCPECHHKRQNSSFKLSIPRISFLLGFSIPKVVMFGPGLESETSGIIKKIFSGPNSPFVVKGMFPGQFDGIGSGVSLQYDGGQLNLITLYSASRHEREHNAANGVRRNKFIIERDDIDAEGIGDDKNELLTVTPPVKDLCASVDAFVYVVDSTFAASRVNIGIEELKAVVNDRWLHPKAPLLVLSCVTDGSNKQYPSIEVADTLGLRELNRPWQVRTCHVNSLYGLLPGIKWLLHEVMKS